MSLTHHSVIVTAIMRIIYLPQSAASKEPTWGSVNASIWAELEGGVGIICACLPTLRAPAMRLVRSLLGSSTQSDSHATYGSASAQLDRSRAKRATLVADLDDAGSDKSEQWQTGPRAAAARWSIGANRMRGESEERIVGIERKVEFHVLEEYRS
jgi:hypothetical protein